MKKLFELLSKPAKWIFVVCAFLVAIAFAVAKAQLVGPGFKAGFTSGFGALVVMIIRRTCFASQHGFCRRAEKCCG